MFRDLKLPDSQDDIEIKFLGLLINENEFNNYILEDDEEEVFKDNSSSEDENESPTPGGKALNKSPTPRPKKEKTMKSKKSITPRRE